jgi:SAM-dependent methyltransferase
MKLLSDEILERSAVVANCRMNRERTLAGSNGYSKEIGFNPIELLALSIRLGKIVSWLDLCCGTGKAIIEAARSAHQTGLAPSLRIVGVDLAGMFERSSPELTCLRLIGSSLSRWSPAESFNLITCVHGLHYIGDKLGLIARAVSWLTADGLLAANLDLRNLKFADGKPAARLVAAEFRRGGLEYQCRRRLVVCRGPRTLELPFRYLGADDQAGPNYTGQPAVDSIYEAV